MMGRGFLLRDPVFIVGASIVSKINPYLAFEDGRVKFMSIHNSFTEPGKCFPSINSILNPLMFTRAKSSQTILMKSFSQNHIWENI